MKAHSPLSHVARSISRSVAAKLVKELENDSDVEVVPTTTARFKLAHELYSDRADKTWGMTDYISFVVMRERKISKH